MAYLSVTAVTVQITLEKLDVAEAGKDALEGAEVEDTTASRSLGARRRCGGDSNVQLSLRVCDEAGDVVAVGVRGCRVSVEGLERGRRERGRQREGHIKREREGE